MSHFSEKIKELRSAAGLTQKVLAEKIGISQGNYSALENGKFEPSLNTLYELSSFYDVSIDELVVNVRFVRELSQDAQFIARKYDLLSYRDQAEIRGLVDLKMRWYNEDQIAAINQSSDEQELSREEAMNDLEALGEIHSIPR